MVFGSLPKLWTWHEWTNPVFRKKTGRSRSVNQCVHGAVLRAPIRSPQRQSAEGSWPSGSFPQSTIRLRIHGQIGKQTRAGLKNIGEERLRYFD